MPEASQLQAVKVLYYIANFKALGETCEMMMASLMHQLFKDPGSPIKHAVKPFRNLGEEFVGSLDVLTRIFSEVMEQETGINFVVVMDGLDELDAIEGRKLIELLCQLKDFPNLGCIVTSRSTPSLDEIAKMDHVTFKRLGPEDLHQGIERFVSASLEKLDLPSVTLQTWTTLIVKRSEARSCGLLS